MEIEGGIGADVPPAFEDEFGFAFRPTGPPARWNNIIASAIFILGFLAGVVFMTTFALVVWYWL